MTQESQGMQVFHTQPLPIIFAVVQGVQQLANGTINLLSIYDRMTLLRPQGAGPPEMVGIQVFTVWTGGQGRFVSIVRVLDADGNEVIENRTEFELPNTSARHYIGNVLVIPARPGVYTITVGREDIELLRQDFTLEVGELPGAEPAQSDR